MLFTERERLLRHKEISGACPRDKGDGVSKGGNAILPFGRRPCGFPAQAKSKQETKGETTMKLLKRLKGIGLLELMLSLAIIAILLVMATRYYGITNRSQQVNQSVTEIAAIEGAIANWKSNKTDYQNLSLSELNRLGLLANQDASGVNTWGGTVTVGPNSQDNNKTAQITLADIPDWACENLADKLSDNNSNNNAAVCAGTTFTLTVQ